MITPTDAQARLLALVEDQQPLFMALGDSGHFAVLYKRGTPAIFRGPDGEGRTALLGDSDPVDPDQEAEGLAGMAQYPRGRVRLRTAQRCLGEGWLRYTPRHDLPQDGELVVELTEDGRIALGLWRQRRLRQPPAAAPTLDGADRDVVALAEHAARLGYKLSPWTDTARLGYKLSPWTDTARQQARRLAREGWVHRGLVGNSVRSLEPTAAGIVEVAPDRADQPTRPTDPG